MVFASQLYSSIELFSFVVLRLVGLSIKGKVSRYIFHFHSCKFCLALTNFYCFLIFQFIDSQLIILIIKFIETISDRIQTIEIMKMYILFLSTTKTQIKPSGSYS